VFINLVPDHVIFHRMYPMAADRTVVECDWLYLPGVVESGKDVSYAHSGNEDWLGHNAIIRFTADGLLVVVLSNSGDVGGIGWSSRVNRAIRRAMDAAR